MAMDTAEMRLLTVPQFASRVNSSVDEVLALIANRDLKALRPDADSGYRVLETEVDRILQDRTTRIKPKQPSLPELDCALKDELAPVAARKTVAPSTARRSIAMETHLAVVTALEISRQESNRQERLNALLQADLFLYRGLIEEREREYLELSASIKAAKQELEGFKLELVKRDREALEREKAVAQSKNKSWWRRFVKKLV